MTIDVKRSEFGAALWRFICLIGVLPIVLTAVTVVTAWHHGVWIPELVLMPATGLTLTLLAIVAFVKAAYEPLKRPHPSDDELLGLLAALRGAGAVKATLEIDGQESSFAPDLSDTVIERIIEWLEPAEGDAPKVRDDMRLIGMTLRRCQDLAPTVDADTINAIVTARVRLSFRRA